MSRVHRLTLAAILAAGVLLRVVQYLSHQSLFVDEAMLGLNIASRSLLELLAPLDYGQTAPVPFLWAERLAITVGGVNEFALRALPLLAGLALPFATWRFCRRFLEPREALLATALTAVSPILIQFSAMVKPYTLDALVAVILADLTVDVMEAPHTARAWLRLLVAGAVAVLVSTPALFVLSGVGLALVLAPRVREQPNWRKQVGLAAALWGGVFASQYILFYRGIASSPYMHEYWADSFLTPGSAHLARNAWLASEYLLLNSFVGSRPQPWGTIVFLLLLAAGVWVLRRREPWRAGLVGGLLLAALTASALGRFPIAPRMLIFAVPAMAVLLAAGLGGITQGVRRPWGVVMFVLVAIGWAIVPLEWTIRRPYRTDGVRQLAAEVERQGEPDVPIYLYSGVVPTWAFYTTDWSNPDTARLNFLARVGSPGGPGFHNARGRGQSVSGEGTDLTVRHRERLELVGTPPGTQFRELTRWSQKWPDPGWAENEVARVRAIGAPEFWVVSANSGLEQPMVLHRAFLTAGARRVFHHEEKNGRLSRYRFP
jgi:dolichyl-phosphate-mannose-protein mannosyltransferase